MSEACYQIIYPNLPASYLLCPKRGAGFGRDGSGHAVQFSAVNDIFDIISLDSGTRAPFVAAYEWLRWVAFSVASRSEAPESKEAGRVPHLQKGLEPTRRE